VITLSVCVVIEESVKILDIENNQLWVEGIQRSACDTCSAQQGCGQSLLAKWAAQPVRLQIPLDGRDANSFEIGQSVTIGIAEHVMVRGSLLIYLLPLIFLLLGIWAGDRAFDHELVAMICGFFALLGGSFLTGKLANDAAHGSKLQAHLLDR
jgi:sigma-E factor negative regulatory protein RseC